MDEKAEKRWKKKLDQREKFRKLERDQFVQEVLKLPQGRNYLWWLMEISQVGRNPYTGNALGTSFNCGELNVGQQIQSHIIEAAPDGYLNMLKERQKEQDDTGREYAQLNTDDDPDDAGD